MIDWNKVVIGGIVGGAGLAILYWMKPASERAGVGDRVIVNVTKDVTNPLTPSSFKLETLVPMLITKADAHTVTGRLQGTEPEVTIARANIVRFV